MLKKVRAMIDNIIFISSNPFLGPKIGRFQKPLLAGGADA